MNTTIRFQGARILGQIELRGGDKKKQDQIAALKTATEAQIEAHRKEGTPAAGFTYCDSYKGYSYKGIATEAEGQHLEGLQTLKRSFEDSVNFFDMPQGERESRQAVAAAVDKAIDAYSEFLFKHVAKEK